MRGLHGVRNDEPRFDSSGTRLQIGDKLFVPWGKRRPVARLTAWADDGRIWCTFTNNIGKQQVRRFEPRACVLVGQGVLFDAGGVR